MGTPRPRSHRDQRGLRRRAPGRRQGTWPAGGHHQCRGRRHCAWPSHRRDRRSADDTAAARDAPRRLAARHGDALHRRRPGHRPGTRSALTLPRETSIMARIPYPTALIVGAGAGIRASLARGLAAAGLKVGMAARDTAKLALLLDETGARAFAVDAADPAGVAGLFEAVDAELGEPDVVVYNASARAHGPIAEID